MMEKYKFPNCMQSTTVDGYPQGKYYFLRYSIVYLVDLSIYSGCCMVYYAGFDNISLLFAKKGV